MCAAQGEDTPEPGDIVYVPAFGENGTVERVAGEGTWVTKVT